MSTTSREIHIEPQELTCDEARAILDRQAQALLGISSEDFIRRWDAGEYADDEESVMSLVMLVPLVR